MLERAGLEDSDIALFGRNPGVGTHVPVIIVLDLADLGEIAGLDCLLPILSELSERVGDVTPRVHEVQDGETTKRKISPFLWANCQTYGLCELEPSPRLSCEVSLRVSEKNDENNGPNLKMLSPH